MHVDIILHLVISMIQMYSARKHRFIFGGNGGGGWVGKVCQYHSDILSAITVLMLLSVLGKILEKLIGLTNKNKTLSLLRNQFYLLMITLPDSRSKY